ncbi:unnamed protein product [Urochloa decumbens]|uniref:4-hydroxy-4-methyl-2-oxoglutarate aldolase n=1 Tax=Urochloa decumbens TaxID=240449 RepID=A0ABC9BX22_9POAL
MGSSAPLAIADICDAYPHLLTNGELRPLPPVFQIYGRNKHAERAIIGGDLAKRAQNNGWVGIVVYGCIRDVDDINLCDIGVRALKSYPVQPGDKGNGEKHVPLTIAGTRVCDGDWLYANSDGILVSSMELSEV